MPMCMCENTLVCGRQTVPNLPPEGSLHFLLMERQRGNTYAGFQVIKLVIGPPSFFCLKGLEAQGMLQRGMDKDLMPLLNVPRLQRDCFPLLPLLQRGERVRKGKAALGPGLC